MTGRRSVLANGAVADIDLRGKIEAEAFVKPIRHRVQTWYSDICTRPDGPRDRQLIQGDAFEVIDTQNEWSFGRSTKDGYVGYVRRGTLAADFEPTHYISNVATHAYTAADIKSGDLTSLPFGAQVRVVATNGGFAETTHGHIPTQHLRAVDDLFDDPRDVAKLFLGTPYLWGGNSPAGIDCSGLVQIALLTCGCACPGDSDQQEEFFAKHATEPGPNQLYFWKGHVALTVSDTHLIHANAHAMAVTVESIGAAIDRIQAAGDGPVTHHVQL